MGWEACLSVELTGLQFSPFKTWGPGIELRSFDLASRVIGLCYFDSPSILFLEIGSLI